jgi:hypothetical protein
MGICASEYLAPYLFEMEELFTEDDCTIVIPLESNDPAVLGVDSNNVSINPINWNSSSDGSRTSASSGDQSFFNSFMSPSGPYKTGCISLQDLCSDRRDEIHRPRRLSFDEQVAQRAASVEVLANNMRKLRSRSMGAEDTSTHKCLVKLSRPKLYQIYEQSDNISPNCVSCVSETKSNPDGWSDDDEKTVNEDCWGFFDI